jgi:hypothetical protein
VNQTSNSKRVKTFVVPGWEEGFSTYCFQFIGQGASFCTAKNCTTAHQHTAKKQAAPGELYISNNGVRDPFLNPSTNSFVKVDNFFLPPIQRTKDVYIMDLVLHCNMFTKKEVCIINFCRMHLQAITMANI